MLTKYEQGYKPALSFLFLGLSLGYSTALMYFTPITISWTGNVPANMLLAAFILIGAATSGFIMDFFGRRLALQLAVFTLVIGCPMKSFVSTAIVHEIGHVLIGYAIGMMTPAICVFVAESAPIAPQISVLESTAGPIVFLGILASFFSSLPLSNEFLYVLIVTSSMVTLVCMTRVPESPLWLESSSSFKLLENREVSTAPGKSMSLRKIFVYVLLQQTCHIFYYDVAKSCLPVDVGASAFYVVVLGATPSLLFSSVVDQPRRRLLSMISSVAVFMTYVVAAEFELCLDTDGANWSWFRKSCVFINLGFGMYGMYSLPWVMIVENTPVRLRGFVTSYLWLLNYGLFLFWLSTYDWIMPSIGRGGVAVIFMTMAIAVVSYQTHFSSTTYEKTLLQIERSCGVNKVQVATADDDEGDCAVNV